MARSSARPVGRHRAGRHRAATRSGSRPVVAVASGTVVLGAAAAIALVALQDATGGAQAAGPRPSTTPSSAPSTPTPTRTTATTGRTPSSTPTRSRAAATPANALQRLTALVAARSGSSTSVAAMDTVTGARVSAGATAGMTMASAVKLQLLESLLLKRQNHSEDLSDGEIASVTAMIEHSDNGAAEDLFWAVGGRPAVVRLEDDLGLSTKRTVPGDADYWGLTTTGAAEQLALLRNLVDPKSPLDAPHRAFALRLLRHVDADQAWGVPVAATSGRPAVKNGWLDIDDDDRRWAVNSLGIVTVGGHTVLIAVLTQHNASYRGGIERVETLARAAAAAVTAS